MVVLIPPQNFGMVEEQLYRSGKPTRLNFPFLETLELKTVLYLAPEEPPTSFIQFTDDQEINLLHLGAETTRQPGMPIQENVVKMVLEAVCDPSVYPLLIMCNLGRHRTGIVVGCLRKLQKWNFTGIFDEYRRFVGGGNKVPTMNEQFIELFDTDLVVIPPSPAPCVAKFLRRATQPSTQHLVRTAPQHPKPPMHAQAQAQAQAQVQALASNEEKNGSHCPVRLPL